jgi:hypothetical protein
MQGAQRFMRQGWAPARPSGSCCAAPTTCSSCGGTPAAKPHQRRSPPERRRPPLPAAPSVLPGYPAAPATPKLDRPTAEMAGCGSSASPFSNRLQGGPGRRYEIVTTSTRQHMTEPTLWPCATGLPTSTRDAVGAEANTSPPRPSYRVKAIDEDDQEVADVGRSRHRGPGENVGPGS